MRALIDNYVNDSTLTASNVNTSYPIDNVRHIFLEKKYMATGSQTIITILFPEDRAVSMIALGFQNMVTSTKQYRLSKTATKGLRLSKTATEGIRIQSSSTYIVKDSAGGTLASGELETGEDTISSYFTAVTARSVELYISSIPSETLYIGGIGIGDPLSIQSINPNPSMGIKSRSTIEVTDGGQSLTKYRRALENFTIGLRSKTNEERKQIVEIARTLREPIYIDLYPTNHDMYRPLYAEFTDIGKIKRESDLDKYATVISVEQRR